MPRLREWRWDSWAQRTRDRVLEDKPDIIAFDTETTGVSFHDEPFAATVTWRSDGELRSGYFDLEDEGREQRIALLRETLLSVGTVVGWNLKFDQQKAILVGALLWDDFDAVCWHDGQTILHLLDENRRKALKVAAVDILGIDDTIEVEIKSGPNKGQKKRVPKEEHQLAAARRKLGLRKEDGYHLLPRRLLIPYALMDAELTLRLYETLMPRLERQSPELVEWYRREMALVPVALRMEADGMALDLPYLDETTSTYGVKVIEGEAKIRDLAGQPELNPNSPAQLLEAFAARNLHLEGTDVATLEPLDDDLAQAVLEYRSAKKIYQTYLRGLQDEQRGGLFHPNFNLVGPRTGRTSSGSAKE